MSHFRLGAIDPQAATARELRGLHGSHLVCPTLRRLWTPGGAHLVRGEARNANIVLPLKHHLDVAWLKRRTATKLAQLTGCSNKIIDKVIGDLEEDLC